MVNTRRKDSLSSHDVGPPRFRTRRKYNYSEEGRQEDETYFESDAQIDDSRDVQDEDVQEEDSSSEEFKISTIDSQSGNRSRELRSRFVSDRKFSNSNSYARTRHEHTSRASNRKVVSSNKRPSLMVYKSSRKILNDESDTHVPSSRNHRNHHDHHKQHRRALSLRPITRKSYNKCYISDTDQEEDINVRRSSRITGTRRNYNMSWLVGEQMHKVGYPNMTKYYDDDSLEATIPNNCRLNATQNTYCDESAATASGDNIAEDTAKDTDEYVPPGHTTTNGSIQVRHRLRASTTGAPSRLQCDKENSDANVHTKPIEDKMSAVKITRQSSRISGGREANGANECSDTEDDEALEQTPIRVSSPTDHVKQGIEGSTIAKRIGRRTRGTYGRSLVGVHDDEEDEFVADKPGVNLKSHVNSGGEGAGNQGDSKDVPSDYEIRRTRRNLQRRTIIESNAQNRRNRKTSESSSSSEASRKGYSLRKRSKSKLKMPSMIISSNRHSQRRFNLRRRKPLPPNMSSSSSSDSDNDEYRTPKKYNNAKSPYTKIDHKSNAGSSKMNAIRPEQMDGSVRFSSVGGLDSHVQCLKEMILLPMMYPEVFERFQIQPPRGILFHGPPGTGKTLIARALANECSFGSRKLSFFMRKGADLLCKWVGESEKQLRRLFDQACEMKPSIIFFDELDGLAPVRSARNDQFHASIVSTLLALMDGLNNRGEVIVIGATNRIDAIDPALRRPGRFDRELYFPLPARKEREEILKVHVSKWQCPPSDHLLSYLAESAIGYCGSDLRALCSEAVIQSFRRVYPQVYGADHILLLNPEDVKVERIDFLRAKSLLVPAAHRVVSNLGRKLLPILIPLLDGLMTATLNIIGRAFPHGTNPSLAKVKLSAGFRPAQLLIFGDGPDHGQTTYLAPALLQRMEHIHVHSLDLAALHRQSTITPEEACIQVFHEAKRNVPSVIYIPCLNTFWDLASKTVQAILITQVTNMDPNLPILILATSDIVYSALDTQLQCMFSQYRYELFQLKNSRHSARSAFYRQLIIDGALRAPRCIRSVRTQSPPPLPRAPTPPPAPLSPGAAQRVFESEERTLSELRIFLRDMCKKLANNRLFFIFTKPVDIEEVPDYTTIIKEPMDLETMMTKVDLHSYQCAKDFLDDIELICQNALEYNPAKTSADKQIRHRACSLRDYAFTLIKNGMDSDFEDKCQEIAQKRKERKASVTQYLSPYLHTSSTKLRNSASQSIASHDQSKDTNQNPVTESKRSEIVATGNSIGTTGTSSTSTNNSHHCSSAVSSRMSGITSGGTSGRKRRIPSWQRGYVTSSKRRRQQRARRSPPFVNIVRQNFDIKKEAVENSKPKDDTNDTPSTTPNHNNLDEEACGKMSSANVALSTSNGKVQGSSNNSPPTQQLLIDTSITDVFVSNCLSPCQIKSDLSETSTSSLRKLRLSDLLSPSELLNDHLEFDDIDQTLNETATSTTQDTIQISRNALNDVLVKVVEATDEQPLQILLDLYYQLSRIVKMYSATKNRTQLPQDLLKELNRFYMEEKHQNILSQSDSNLEY